MHKKLIAGISILAVILTGCGMSTGTKKAKPKYSSVNTTKYCPINQAISTQQLKALKPNNTKYFHHTYSIQREVIKVGKKFQGSATYVIKDLNTDLTYASVTSGTKTFNGFKIGDKATFAINGLTKLAKNGNLNGLTSKDNPSRLSTVTIKIGKY